MSQLLVRDPFTVPRHCFPMIANRLGTVGLALALLALPGLVYGQAIATVTGRVTDAATGESISSASIRAVGTQAGTTTRADGTYRLTLPPGTYELRATF